MSVRYTTKEAIAAKLYDKINAVSQFQNRVERQYVEVGTYEYPGVFINDVRETRRRVLKDAVHVVWTALLILYVFDEGTTLSTTLNSTLASLISAVKADPTLDNLVYNTKIIQVDTDEGFLRPHGVALLTTEVEFLTQV